jgi:NAD(P)-dependent dehydrogenase (short-subunit alcohol dehydrogenase family)
VVACAPMVPTELDGVVAWVAGADREQGRAVALALASLGARVLVTGDSERSIAECVGEIAHAGGKARHFVGNACSPAAAQACREAAIVRFGALHVAVLGETDVPVPPDPALAVVHLPRAASERDAVQQAVATARRPS